MNTSEVEALFAQTLRGEYDGEEGWAAVRALHREGSREIFERAAAWCLSDDARKRARAADILGQLGVAPATKLPDGNYHIPKLVFGDESC